MNAPALFLAKPNEEGVDLAALRAGSLCLPTPVTWLKVGLHGAH